jgi:hypothetical protein
MRRKKGFGPASLGILMFAVILMLVLVAGPATASIKRSKFISKALDLLGLSDLFGIAPYEDNSGRWVEGSWKYFDIWCDPKPPPSGGSDPPRYCYGVHRYSHSIFTDEDAEQKRVRISKVRIDDGSREVKWGNIEKGISDVVWNIDFQANAGAGGWGIACQPGISSYCFVHGYAPQGLLGNKERVLIIKKDDPNQRRDIHIDDNLETIPDIECDQNACYLIDNNAQGVFQSRLARIESNGNVQRGTPICNAEAQALDCDDGPGGLCYVKCGQQVYRVGKDIVGGQNNPLPEQVVESGFKQDSMAFACSEKFCYLAYKDGDKVRMQFVKKDQSPPAQWSPGNPMVGMYDKNLCDKTFGCFIGIVDLFKKYRETREQDPQFFTAQHITKLTLKREDTGIKCETTNNQEICHLTGTWDKGIARGVLYLAINNEKLVNNDYQPSFDLVSNLKSCENPVHLKKRYGLGDILDPNMYFDFVKFGIGQTAFHVTTLGSNLVCSFWISGPQIEKDTLRAGINEFLWNYRKYQVEDLQGGGSVFNPDPVGGGGGNSGVTQGTQFQCHDLMINGDPRDKMNIVVIGDGYSESQAADLENAAQMVFDFNGNNNQKGVFYAEPFKSQKAKFNFYYAARGNMAHNSSTGSPLRCYTYPNNDTCDPGRDQNGTVWGLLLEGAAGSFQGCPNTNLIDRFAIISKWSFRDHAYSGLVSADSLPGSPAIQQSYGCGANYFCQEKCPIGGDTCNSPGRITTHEFGHLIGELADEYVEQEKGDVAPVSPNCADTIAQANSWWTGTDAEIVATPGSDGCDQTVGQWYHGCSYVCNNYRPYQNSIMRNQFQVSAQFGQVNSNRIVELINNAIVDHGGTP